MRAPVVPILLLLGGWLTLSASAQEKPVGADTLAEKDRVLYETLAKKFEDWINQRTEGKPEDFFDVQQYFPHALPNQMLQQTSKAILSRAVTAAMNDAFNSMRQNSSVQEWKFLRLVKRPAGWLASYRLYGDAGINYFELLIGAPQKSTIHFIDGYNALTAEYLSETSRRQINLMEKIRTYCRNCNSSWRASRAMMPNQL